MKSTIKKNPAKVVVICGGTGGFAILTGLKDYFSDITAIVTMADNGGSTKILREDFGILPPGDVRRALIALSRTDNEMLSELFNYRFAEGKGLSGHSFGNLMITALERITGSFEKALAEAQTILSVKGTVLPVTLSRTDLCVKLEDGRTVCGETDIDIPKHNGNLAIRKAWLRPGAKANPRAIKAIKEADLIIISSGDLYTSIVANLLVKGIPEAVRRSKARVIYFLNIMTKYGETAGFQASDFVRVLEKYLGKDVLDGVVVNTSKPSPARLRKYEDLRAEPVVNDLKDGFFEADLLRSHGFIRHDPEKTARFVYELLENTGKKR
jgi:uncharacterized cofD-like protein